MKEFAYDEQDRLMGEIVDEVLMPLSPAPTGEAFDDLHFAACEMIEHHPLKHGRLADNLRPNKGRHSTLLSFGRVSTFMKDDGTPDPNFKSLYGGGIAAYITEGALRSVEQLRDVLIDYVDGREELYRRGRIGKDGQWEFTITDIWEMGRQFGLVPPPPPTEEERAARAEQDRVALEVRNEEIRQSNAREVAWLVERRKKDLLQKFVVGGYPLDHLD